MIMVRALIYIVFFFSVTAVLLCRRSPGRTTSSLPVVSVGGSNVASAGENNPDELLFSGEQDTTGYWVYLGQYNFYATGIPLKGDRMTTRTELLTWDQPPSREGQAWKMGRLTGQLPSPVTVEVMQVRRLGRMDYWVQVRCLILLNN